MMVAQSVIRPVLSVQGALVSPQVAWARATLFSPPRTFANPAVFTPRTDVPAYTEFEAATIETSRNARAAAQRPAAVLPAWTGV